MKPEGRLHAIFGDGTSEEASQAEVELACKEHKLGELFTELRGMTVSAEVVNSMLVECIKQKDLIGAL